MFHILIINSQISLCFGKYSRLELLHQIASQSTQCSRTPRLTNNVMNLSNQSSLTESPSGEYRSWDQLWYHAITQSKGQPPGKAGQTSAQITGSGRWWKVKGVCSRHLGSLHRPEALCFIFCYAAVADCPRINVVIEPIESRIVTRTLLILIKESRGSALALFCNVLLHKLFREIIAVDSPTPFTFHPGGEMFRLWQVSCLEIIRIAESLLYKYSRTIEIQSFIEIESWSCLILLELRYCNLKCNLTNLLAYQMEVVRKNGI